MILLLIEHISRSFLNYHAILLILLIHDSVETPDIVTVHHDLFRHFNVVVRDVLASLHKLWVLIVVSNGLGVWIPRAYPMARSR